MLKISRDPGTSFTIGDDIDVQVEEDIVTFSISKDSFTDIAIGDDIMVYCLGEDRNQLKIGIEAPRHIDIVRDNAKKRK